MWALALKDYLDNDNPLAVSEAMVRTYVEVGGQFGRNQYQRLKRHKAIGDINDQIDLLMATYARDKLGGIVKSIQDTSRKMYLDIVNADNLTLAEQAELIDQMISRRSLLIANDQISAASNEGILAGTLILSLETGRQFARTWLATIDSVVRPEHEEADGQTVRGREPFIVGGEALQRPQDPAGSAWNTANCRCSVDTIEI